MSKRHYYPSVWRLSVLIATLLCGGELYATFGQDWNLKIGGDSRPNRAPDPPTDPKRIAGKRPNNRAKQSPSNHPHPLSDTRTNEKQQAIEQAITQGNEARGKNNYGLALAHYQRVTKALNPLEARAFYGTGNVYSDLYCHDSAIEAYLNALELKKDYLEARVGLGYAYIAKERYDDALKEFKAAQKLVPKNVDANIGLGSVYAKQGKYQEAIEQIDQIIKDQSINDKDRASAYVALGNTYWKQEKWQETIAQYEKAITLNPKFANAYLNLGAAQMTSAFSKFGSIGLQGIRVQDRERLAASARQAAVNIQKAMNEVEHKYKHPDAYLFLSRALMLQARYQDAVSNANAYFAKVKELENQLSSIDTNITTKCGYGFDRLNATGYSHLGFVYLNESSLETNNQRKTELLNEASEKCKQAIKLKQDYAEAYHMLGLIYFQQGKDEEAIEQYKKAILYSTEESSKAQLYDSIGLGYLRMRRYDGAVEHVREAIKLNPNEPSFYESLATIYVMQGNIEETFNSLKKADEVRTAPSTSPNPYYYLGTAYVIRFIERRNEADFNEAIKWLKKAIEIRPEAVYYSVLGTAYENHSNADEALASYKKAAQYAPKEPKIYLYMAQVYFDLKHNDDAAIGLLKQAIELKTDYAEAYLRLGRVYRHKKDNAQAIEQLLNAIKYNPKYLQAYLDLADVYDDQKNYPEAIKHLLRATEIAPENSQPYKELGRIYDEQQKYEDAAHYYDEAIKRLAVNDSYLKDLYMGRAARLRGQYAEAIGYFQKLIPFEPHDRAYYELGRTYVASKDNRAALEQHQRLVQLKSPLAEELLKKIKEMN